MECWKAIPGYEGIYEASTFGRVRSLREISQRCNKLLPKPLIRKPVHASRDRRYEFYKLYKNGTCVFRPAGRIFLETFTGRCPGDKYQASHLDGNPSNNRIGNLVWETAGDNNRRKKVHGTQPCGELTFMAKISNADAMRAYNLVKSGISTAEVSRMFNVTRTAISKLCLGKSWKWLNLKPIYKEYITCIRGHKYDTENTYFNKYGHRKCRACARYLRRINLYK